MKNKKTLYVHFYEILGKLFYAIAAVDGVVKPAEINKLKVIVKNQWLSVDKTEDHFHSDAAYQIKIIFDWLNEQNNLNSENLFNDFVTFKNEQKHLFTQPINELIIKTAHEIADSFSGKNKSELILLAKIRYRIKENIIE